MQVLTPKFWALIDKDPNLVKEYRAILSRVFLILMTMILLVLMSPSWYLPSSLQDLNPSKKSIQIGKVVQAPLNIWTEHSNCQIHSRGGLKNPYSFTDTQYFLDFFMKLFFCAYKSWGHDPIWFFSSFGRKRKLSELRALLFSELY